MYLVVVVAEAVYLGMFQPWFGKNINPLIIFLIDLFQNTVSKRSVMFPPFLELF